MGQRDRASEHKESALMHRTHCTYACLRKTQDCLLPSHDMIHTCSQQDMALRPQNEDYDLDLHSEVSYIHLQVLLSSARTWSCSSLAQ